MTNTEMTVVDREAPGAMWEIRKRIGATAAGPAFAKWLASADRGRFLLITWAAGTVEELLFNAATEEELLAEIRQRIAVQGVSSFKIYGPPALMQKWSALEEFRGGVGT